MALLTVPLFCGGRHRRSSSSTARRAASAAWAAQITSSTAPPAAAAMRARCRRACPPALHVPSAPRQPPNEDCVSLGAKMCCSIPCHMTGVSPSYLHAKFQLVAPLAGAVCSLVHHAGTSMPGPCAASELRGGAGCMRAEQPCVRGEQHAAELPGLL
jgi:hypothetical protein